ncbi:MAG TPA: DUF748 domain-containing protein [Syntrophales bacterium]|nr:DUF748 domain-containing protein [Syntrophales bacterium]
MSRASKVILSIVVLIFVLLLAAYFYLPSILKPILIKELSKALHREVTLKQITVNPFRLTATIDSFEVKEPGGKETFIGFDELFLNIDAFSLFRRMLVLKEMRLTNPAVRVIRNADGSYNFSDLIPKEEKKSEPLPFSLNNIYVENGKVDFWDGPKKTWHKAKDINIRVPFISDVPSYADEYVTPYFSANINGGIYTLQGKTKPFSDSKESSIDIDIENLDIPYYLTYVPFKPNFKMLSGLLDIKANISFHENKDKKPSIAIKGDVKLKNLALDEPGEQRLLRVPLFHMAAVSVEPLASVYHFSKIALSKPEVVVRRSKDGKLNLLSLLPPAGKEEKKEKEKTPLTFKVDELGIEDGKVEFHDAQPPREAVFVISSLSLKGTHLSTEKNAKANMSLSLNLNKTGTLSVSGPFVVDPLSASLAVDVNSLNFSALQPYIEDKLKVAITDGSVSTSGNLTLATTDKEGPTVKYDGKSLVANVAMIDKSSGNSLLRWNSLFFKELRAGYNPFYLRIRDISLTDFYARVIVLPDGTLNLQHLMEEKPVQQTPPVKPAQGAKAQTAEPLKDIRVGRVSLQGGTINFEDRYIKPNYGARLVEIGGRVSGVSSIKRKPADVDLRGKLNNTAPLEITGKLHPFPEDLFVDLKVILKGVDMGPFSPYSGKYAGYTIKKGKLSLDLRYQIVKDKVDATNKIFLSQFTFGDAVESAQATKLPVTTAISLMKDSNGDINLNIPVTGSLKDPQFSVWDIITKAIGNLFEKAVTAPFALLGSLFAHGAELSYVEFDPGSSALSDAGMKKVESLVKVLKEKPDLKLDIIGHVDIEKDTEGLKKRELDKKVKLQKLNEMIHQGQRAATLNDVKINDYEYNRYLTQAYKAESFPKPTTAFGVEKDLSPAEMEKLMLTNFKVNEGDLRLLASRRAARVEEAILKDGTVSADRVFVVEPKNLEPTKKDVAKGNRVTFALR